MAIGKTNSTTYAHPSHTAKSSGLYKVTVDSQGHVSAATAVTKSDITGLGIPAQDTTYSAATTSAAGLMSASDKSKLDGIATGATKVTVDSALSSTSTNPVQNKVINTALAEKAPSGLGLGETAKVITDTDLLDTLKSAKSGFYMGSNVTNAPTTDWWIFQVISHSAVHSAVLAFSIWQKDILRGSFIDGEWSGWSEIYTEYNKPTADDVAAKSLKGGTEISPNTDLNTVRTVGNYHCISDSTSATLTNCPITRAFTMSVSYPTGQNAYIAQELIDYLSGTRYYRECLASSETAWTDWVKTYDTQNKPTPAEIGAAVSGEHNLKTYTSMTQLGLTVGEETIEAIANALPGESELICSTTDSCAAIYPNGKYGLLRVTKKDTSRIKFEWMHKDTGVVYVGAYSDSNSTPWTGWKELYNESSSGINADTVDGIHVQTTPGNAGIKPIYATTVDLTAGTSALETGTICFVYE